jgi:hypothetical protein
MHVAHLGVLGVRVPDARAHGRNARLHAGCEELLGLAGLRRHGCAGGGRGAGEAVAADADAELGEL